MVCSYYIMQYDVDVLGGSAFDKQNTFSCDLRQKHKGSLKY